MRIPAGLEQRWQGIVAPSEKPTMKLQRVSSFRIVITFQVQLAQLIYISTMKKLKNFIGGWIVDTFNQIPIVYLKEIYLMYISFLLISE